MGYTMHRLLFCFMLLAIVQFAGAQQLPIYTQYKLNAHVLNPAISGAHGFTTVNMTTRDQWLGFKGSPNTYTVSAEWRLLKRQTGVGSGLLGIRRLQKSRGGNVGLGGVIYRDVNGAVSRTGIKGAYAYHINLRSSQISFGMALTTFQFKINKNELIWNDPDPKESEIEPVIRPDASIGTYFLTRSFYAGLAGDQLFQASIRLGSSLEKYRLLRHYYFLSGYRLYLTNEYDIEPSVLVKISEPEVKGFSNKLKGLSYQSDIMLKLNYKDDYWGGLLYRTNGDLVAIMGVRYSNFYIAYSFDYTLSRIMSYSYGSHELSIGMKLGASEQKFKWMDRY